MNFIWPEDLNDLTNEQLQVRMLEIRSRRERVGEYLKAAKKVRDGITLASLKNHVQKQLDAFVKDYDKADKAIEKIEKRMSAIMALRLQVDDGEQSGTHEPQAG